MFFALVGAKPILFIKRASFFSPYKIKLLGLGHFLKSDGVTSFTILSVA
jgi:hypothetical protein